MASFRQFLKSKWSYISFGLLGLYGSSQKIRVPQYVLNKFDLLLKHVGLCKRVSAEISDSNLAQSVPLLQQLCRFIIRCCVIQKHQTLQPVH